MALGARIRKQRQRMKAAGKPAVKLLMLRLTHYFQILFSVVRSLAVTVVHHLSREREKRPAKFLFHDQAMLGNLFAIHPKEPVSVLPDAAGAEFGPQSDRGVTAITPCAPLVVNPAQAFGKVWFRAPIESAHLSRPATVRTHRDGRVAVFSEARQVRVAETACGMYLVAAGDGAALAPFQGSPRWIAVTLPPSVMHRTKISAKNWLRAALKSAGFPHGGGHMIAKRIGLVILVLLGLSFSARASTSTLNGTVLDAAGNAFNGRVAFSLPTSAVDTNTGAAIAPTVVSYAVRNGNFQPNSTLEDVMTLQPSGLYYTARRYDVSGQLLSTDNYLVTGTLFNFGMAIPAAVTTTNITYLNPASLSLPQTWTAQQNFASITIGGGGALNHVYTASPTITFTSIGSQTCQEQSFTVTGISSSPVLVIASPTTFLGANGLDWSARGGGTNLGVVRVCNPTTGPITPTAVQWQVIAIQ